MFDHLFLFRLFLSFVVGGLFITLVTRVSEILGPKIGGAIAATPSTALVGMIFLGLTEGTSALPKAAPSMLAGFGVSLVFLTIYAHLRARNKSVMLAALTAAILWLVISTCVGLLNISSIIVGLLIFIICFIAVLFFFKSDNETKSLKRTVKPQALLSRAIFSGAIVASVVLFARLIGPEWGGVAAAFPALYLSSIIILEKDQGKSFTISVLKQLPISSISLAIFSIAIGFLAGNHTLFVTIILSTLASLIFTTGLLVYRTNRH